MAKVSGTVTRFIPADEEAGSKARVYFRPDDPKALTAGDGSRVTGAGELWTETDGAEVKPGDQGAWDMPSGDEEASSAEPSSSAPAPASSANSGTEPPAPKRRPKG